MSSESVGGFLTLIIWVAIILVVARVVLDYVQMLARNWRPSGVVAVLCEGIYSVTDPPLRAVRRVIPPLRLGSVILDLSTLVVIFGLYVLMQIVYAIFY